MAKYKTWDKTEDIYTPAGKRFTATEWAQKYPWINQKGAVMVIADDIINGAFCAELHTMKKTYEQSGAVFEEGLTDEALLQAIEAYEISLSQEPSVPSAEERIAAALEAQVMMALPDTESSGVSTLSLDDSGSAEESIESPAYARIERCYRTGLWSTALLHIAVQKGEITQQEREKIFSGV